MKSLIFATLLSLLAGQAAYSQTKNNGDTREFLLTPVPPPMPVLEYKLIYGYPDRHPGNAALKYLTASNLMGEEFSKQIYAASDALESKSANFKTLAAKLGEATGTLALLEQGAECDNCDWDIPIREQGIRALIPYLQTLRADADLLAALAAYQAQDNEPDDAVATLRMGYELGHKTADVPILVNGLVGVGIAGVTNEATIELMNQPSSPNLYWALADLPHPFALFPRAMQGEPSFIIASVPGFPRKNLDEISSEQWRNVMGNVAALTSIGNNNPAKTGPNDVWAGLPMVVDEVDRDFPKAAALYAATYGLTADQVGQLDHFKVVCTYWCQEYFNISDEQQAAANLSYPLLIPLMNKYSEEVRQLTKDQPANPLLLLVASLNRAPGTFGKLDRQIAALTDVEAIRSYAAAHGGALPVRLKDITGTPALDNPLTGKPFDYKVDGDTATLSEPSPDNYPLTYTIRIRK